MAWSGGTFTRIDGPTGWQDDAGAGIPIQASLHDTAFNDLATDGINQCINKTGQNTPTANLPMGGFRHTNCANAVADTDYTTLGQVRAGIDTYASGLGTTATNYQANGTGAYLRLRKSRGAAFPTTTIVQQNDEAGVIAFSGANGTTFDDCAAIQGAIDGVPGATNDMPGRLVFYTKADNSATMNERLRIDSKGRHAITADSTNEYALAVVNQSLTNSYGLIVDAARTNFALAVRDSGNQYRHVFNADGSLTIGGAANAINVTSAGNVGIRNASPSYLLHVGGATGGPQITVDGGNSGTGNGSSFIVRNAGTAIIGIGNYSAIAGGAYSNAPTIYGNGTAFQVVNLTSGAGTIGMKYNTGNGQWTYDVSSARYKENIRSSQYGLAAVMQLQPKQFNYKDGGREDVGFIAEEVVNVIPELVPLDASGNPEAVNYDRLTSVLCKAIQELEVRVAALEANN